MKIRLYTLVVIICNLCLTGCYIGQSNVTPERVITVEDMGGNKLSGYDLYIYRCLRAGSRMDQIFLFKNQDMTPFHLKQTTKLEAKEFGGVWLAPDFYMSYESEPYWVACVSKEGFEDRRWQLGEHQGKEIKIQLKDKGTPKNVGDEDFCHTEKLKCSACKNYEYFMYEPRRFRGCNTEINPRPEKIYIPISVNK